MLNCFAYTCAFGVAAAAGGAHTVNVDLSKRYLDWGRRNYALNDLDPACHEFLFGDVFEWLKRFHKKQRTFDCIVLDPPTFSRDGKGRTFTVAAGFSALARAAAELLTPEGVLFCSTNQRTLTDRGFQRIIADGLPARWKFRFVPMPPDFRAAPYLKACWLHRA